MAGLKKKIQHNDNDNDNDNCTRNDDNAINTRKGLNIVKVGSIYLNLPPKVNLEPVKNMQTP